MALVLIVTALRELEFGVKRRVLRGESLRDLRTEPFRCFGDDGDLAVQSSTHQRTPRSAYRPPRT